MREIDLVLEASTATGSLALVRGTSLLAEASVPPRGGDGDQLMPTLVRLLGTAAVSTADLRRVVCGGGPGGFTSLRIAAAIGKGLAESLGIALWEVSSLALLAAGELHGTMPSASSEASEHHGDGVGSFRPARALADAADAFGAIAVLDALRGEWHARHFVRNATTGLLEALGPATRLGREALVGRAVETGATIVGAGGEGFSGGRSATPRARDVRRLHEGEFLRPVELETWEPDYGRLAEAQVRWEASHGRPLGTIGSTP